MSSNQKKQSEILPVLTFNQKCSSSEASESNLKCLKCTRCWEFPKDKDDCLAHLFLEHRLIIADVDEIALLKEYLQFWQNEFKDAELAEYCTTMLLDQLPDGTPAKNEKYYLLSDIVPKDYELRKRLHQQRLEQVLSLYQKERTDRNFSKECLYCRDVITGLRTEYVEHLINKHFLILGKIENLVYIDELVAKLEKNLQDFICLFCEKTFKDRVVLKEHMRKKAHKRINPNNRDYDKYFLQNYRHEKAKPNAKQTKTKAKVPSRAAGVAATDPSSSAKPSNRHSESSDFEQRFCNADNNSDVDWCDWEEEECNESMQLAFTCLFCAHKEKTFASLKQHMETSHKLKFDEAMQGLNFYQRIKVVNYLRRQICLLRCVSCNMRCENNISLLDHMDQENHVGIGTQKQWNKPEYFFPTYEDDAVLCALDDNHNDDNEELDDTLVKVISEDSKASINKDAELLSLENFKYL